MNISNFIQWFITQFVNIGTNLLAKLDEIILIGNISLLNFVVTLAIISAFLSILVTAPELGVAKREISRRERVARQERNRWNKDW